MNEDDTLPPIPSRQTLRPIVLVVWLATILLLVLAAARLAQAAPLYRAGSDKVQLTLRSEPCAVPEVINLPKRAVWKDGDKITEGCWGSAPFGMVVLYFADRTAMAIPQSQFTPVQES